MKYQARVERLGQCLANLHNFENVNVAAAAQLVLINMRVEQYCLQKEAKKQIKDRNHHLDQMRVSY